MLLFYLKAFKSSPLLPGEDQTFWAELTKPSFQSQLLFPATSPHPLHGAGAILNYLQCLTQAFSCRVSFLFRTLFWLFPLSKISGYLLFILWYQQWHTCPGSFFQPWKDCYPPKHPVLISVGDLMTLHYHFSLLFSYRRPQTSQMRKICLYLATCKTPGM